METSQNPEARLARKIREHRDRQRMTAQELANRVVAAGGKLSRQAISKIENEERSVSIDELMLLAYALSVPPVLLLFPVLTEEKTEALPGRTVDTIAAMRWVSGEAPLPGDSATEWEQGAVAALLARRYVEAVEEYDELDREALDLASRDGTTDQGVERLARLLAEAGDRVRNIRAEMRRHGLVPPAWAPKALTVVDLPTGSVAASGVGSAEQAAFELRQRAAEERKRRAGGRVMAEPDADDDT